jgi:4-hydroxy-3-polyprenylbenzoate decarboxylase
LAIIAITGASGAVYGLKLVDELLKRGDDVELIISPSGFIILKEELALDLALSGVDVAKELGVFLVERFGTGTPGASGVKPGVLRSIASNDMTAALASGSSMKRAMVICPCSMGTLSRVSAGNSGNLIERAADCILKERGMLVLVPRETPLSAIHLENMLRLTRAGAIILPAMPAFYQGPETIDDMVSFVVGKVLDMLGLENGLYRRWRS